MGFIPRDIRWTPLTVISLVLVAVGGIGLVFTDTGKPWYIAIAAAGAAINLAEHLVQFFRQPRD
jgi:hypothetical protein